MNQTIYSPDKFGTYLSHPGSHGCDIDFSPANVLEILLAYRAFRQTLNACLFGQDLLPLVAVPACATGNELYIKPADAG